MPPALFQETTEEKPCATDDRKLESQGRVGPPSLSCIQTQLVTAGTATTRKAQSRGRGGQPGAPSAQSFFKSLDSKSFSRSCTVRPSFRLCGRQVQVSLLQVRVPVWPGRRPCWRGRRAGAVVRREEGSQLAHQCGSGVRLRPGLLPAGSCALTSQQPITGYPVPCRHPRAKPPLSRAVWTVARDKHWTRYWPRCPSDPVRGADFTRK